MSAHLAAEVGDRDRARAELEAMAHAGYRAVNDDAHYLFSLCCLAEAAILLDDRVRAGELFDLLIPHRDTVVPNITALHGTVAHTCGGLALVCDEPAVAHDLLDAALASHLAFGATSWVIGTRLRLAEAVAEDGAHRRELLEAVTADADARGLTRLAQQAAAQLGRTTPSRPHPFDQLTARELDVVALLAEGRSNVDIARQLYVSVQTVKSHVSHVLTKLGLTSRTQVALLFERSSAIHSKD
jgi:DNA-binding CsgD family transcriptional regulator